MVNYHSNKEIITKELGDRRKIIYDYIFGDIQKFRPDDIYESVMLYPGSSGKSLRPSVLLLCCGAVGGEEKIALPAAAAVELFHTWTLVHDDWIDRDSFRRGVPTVHSLMKEKALKTYKFDQDEAEHYGGTISMLTGDVQQGWSIGGFMANLSLEHSVDPMITLNLIRKLALEINIQIVEGETLDVLYSKKPINEISEEDIIMMLYLKTGVLYQFCGEAGAIIGLKRYEPENEYVQSLSEFTKHCGIAFQIQDDVIGVVGNETVVGKPRWSDIKEGKRTIILWKAYQEADSKQIKFLESILGNQHATIEELQSVEDLFVDLGAVDYTKELAKAYIVGDRNRPINGALKYLDVLPDNNYKDILKAWAHYMIERDF